MNAEAHLRAQGWGGPGTGLRTGSLQRAILTSKKIDQKGLGAKQNESDQWWDNIFSSQLSNIAIGANGQISQINGGIKAAHPVAARHAHSRQFGGKSALEKVFRIGEVLKGSETFIPLQLAPALATAAIPAVQLVQKSAKSHTILETNSNSETRSKKRKSKSTQKVDTTAANGVQDSLTEGTQTLLSPPPSPALGGTERSTRDKSTKSKCKNTNGLKALSDKQIRREAKRIRRESRALRRAERAARKEKRRSKRSKKPII